MPKNNTEDTETRYVVYIADTLSGTSQRRKYKSYAAALRYYNELLRVFKRNGHNYVAMTKIESDGSHQNVYPGHFIASTV